MEAEIIYEDFVTGLRAHFLITRVWQHLAIRDEPKLHLCRFDLLAHPELHQPGGKQARTDLAMLSAHGNGPVPQLVMQWVGDWLSGLGANPGSMIVSLDPNLEGCAAQLPFLTQLQGLLHRGAADTVPCFFEPPQLGALVWNHQMHERTHRPLAGMKDFGKYKTGHTAT